MILKVKIFVFISSLPQKDWKFSYLYKYIFFLFMDDMGPEIFTYNTVPSWACAFIHLTFKITGEYFFLFILFDWSLKTFV